MMNDDYGLKFRGTISVWNDTNNCLDGVFHNITTDVFFSELANFFTGSGGNGVRYFGISDTLGVIVSSRTFLTNEVFRKLINSLSTSGSDMIFTISIDGSDAIGAWKEIALFEDSASGNMFTIAEVDYTHLTGEALTITYKLEKA